VPERDDAAATANRASVVDAGLRFAQGPITAMLSWQRTDASGAVAAVAHPLGVATPATGGDSTLWMLGARYAMGALALSGGYWQERVELGTTEVADITGWTLAVRYTMGPWAFTAAHTQSEDDALTANQIFSVTGERTAKRTVLGLGVDYSFSKRTALYGRFEGRDMGPTEFQTIQVGIRHTF
jgi:predicted porin